VTQVFGIIAKKRSDLRSLKAMTFRFSLSEKGTVATSYQFCPKRVQRDLRLQGFFNA
jgi:hypothetical protein